jgi:signal transduction histidine kinase
MSKTPLSPAAAEAEAKRLAGLLSTGLLDSPPEEAFDRISRLAIRFLKVPVALVSLVDDRRQFFKSAIGLPEPWASQRETPLSHSFCQHVTATGEPLVVENAKLDERVCDNLAIPDLGVIGYLGMPITLNSGETIGSFCAIDGKPREWSDQEIATMQDLAHLVVSEIELRMANQSQADMMAIVSHDLKNPISALDLTSTMMARKLSSAATLEEARASLPLLFQRMKNTTSRMRQLVLEVLDQARADSGPLPIEVAQHSAREILSEAIEAVSARAEEKGVKLSFAPNFAELSIPCDRSRIAQVLGNIVNNAVEYTPAGGEVRVMAEAMGSKLCITVADQGPGIPVALRQKIFEKFWRAPGSGSRGHGLGLFIASKLMAAHNGSISVGGEDGKGAIFQIELPLSSS